MIRFAADENFDGRILKGIQSRLPDIDIIRVQDTSMYGASDPDLLEWLAKENRVLLTHDVQTIPDFVYRRIRENLPVAGVIQVRKSVSNSQLLDDLEVLMGAGEAQDFENTIYYIPF